MNREALLLDRVRGWARDGRIADLTPWLRQHGLVPLLPDLAGEEEARTAGRRILAENLILRQQALDALAAMREAGVPGAPLKGIDLLDRLYHNREGHRRTSDIDLLVPDERLGEALAAIETLGYVHSGLEPREAQARWSHQITYEGPRGAHLEIHRQLSQDMGFTVTWRRLAAAGLLEAGAGPEGSHALTLDALLVHLLVHMAAHRFGGDSLRWVLDILVLLDRFESALDGERVLAVAESLGARRAAGAAVAAVARLLPDADLGPLAVLPHGGQRERWALRLIDLERAALLGEAGWTPRASFLSRALLGPGGGSTVGLLVAKFRLRRSRRDHPGHGTGGAHD